jgi:hypothetical protein
VAAASTLSLLTGARRPLSGLVGATRDGASAPAGGDGGFGGAPASPFAGGINGPIVVPGNAPGAERGPQQPGIKAPDGPILAPTAPAGPATGAQPTGDPVLDAALANLAEQERRAQGDFSASQTQISSGLDPGLADIAKQYTRNSRSLLASQEGRGVLRSGETDTRIADLTSDRVGTEAALRKSIADQLSQANLGLTDRMGEIAGNRTTALGDAAARKAQREAQQAAEQRAFEQQQAQQAAAQAFSQQEAEKQRQWEGQQAAAQEAERERQFQQQMQAQQAAQQQAQQAAAGAQAQQAQQNAIDPETGLTVGARQFLEATGQGAIIQALIAQRRPPAQAPSSAGATDRSNPLNYTAGGRRILAS